MTEFNDFQILGDWFKNLIDRAIKIESDKSEFNEGLLQGYYESISHIITQLDLLGLMEKLDDDYLRNFDPDDLLRGDVIGPFQDRSKDDPRPL